MTQCPAHNVKFTLVPRYFNGTVGSSNSFPRKPMQDILRDVFGLQRHETDCLMNTGEYHGFEIECTPEQFGYFIIRRYQANLCVNGVKDLAPKLIPKCKSDSETPYIFVADRT
jgi:hypothetical protein